MERQTLEQTLALKEELARRRDADPLLAWEPHQKQRPFVQAVVERGVRSAWYLGGNRTGKSDAGAYCGSHLARFGRPDPKPQPFAGARIEMRDRATSGWVIGLDWPTLRGTIQPKYFDNGYRSPGAHDPFIPEREIKHDGWRVSDQVLRLRNGSIIEFKSCEAEPSKLQGSGKDWIHFDEAPPRPHYEEATIRVEAGRSLQVFGTCTLLPPVGARGGVSWVFSEIVKPWKRGELPHVEIYSAGIYDNPHIGAEEIAYLEALFPEGTPARQIRLEGALIPGIGGARAYAAFDRRVHMKEQQINARAPLCWAWDFNVRPMVSVVGQRYDSVFRFIDELWIEDGGNIPAMVEMFVERWGNHAAEIWIYGDATGSNRNSQSGASDYQTIANECRPYDIRFRRKIRTKNPFVSNRLNAVNRALRNEHGISNVEIDPKCRHLVEDLEEVLMDPHGGIRKSREPSDPYYLYTHISDAAGYWIEYEAPVKSTAAFAERVVHRVRDVAYAFR